MKLQTINKSFKLSFHLIILISLLGCNFNATYINRVEDKNDAQKVTNKFYNLIENGKYNDTYKLFSKKFFEVTGISKMNNMYQITLQKFGAIENVNLDHWETKIVKGTNPSSYYTLYFLVKREKYESKETVSLLKENDTIKIIGYKINSDGFFASDSTK